MEIVSTSKTVEKITFCYLLRVQWMQTEDLYGLSGKAVIVGLLIVKKKQQKNMKVSGLFFYFISFFFYTVPRSGD